MVLVVAVVGARAAVSSEAAPVSSPVGVRWEVKCAAAGDNNDQRTVFQRLLDEAGKGRRGSRLPGEHGAMAAGVTAS